ncbi:GAF domain-containing protein [Streptomyces sp. H51]|uniref:sensor histidine kinase n=1 Tax=Streptomyces sp. H51 TaxID=3111770 RepID=UPI002D7847A1|nr:GAF domain-containing protein [Streptomyces sp. H51]
MNDRSGTNSEGFARRLPSRASPDGRRDHARRAADGRDRMQTLLDAVVAISGDLDLEDLLRRIVQYAAELVDAEYGALGVLGEAGRIRQFVTVDRGAHCDEQPTVRRTGSRPESQDLPDPLTAPLRGPLTDPSADQLIREPRSLTFLDSAVQARGEVYGTLYLAGKRNGRPFDADDESILRSLAAAAGVAVDNARLYDESRHRERRLAAGADLTRALLSGEHPARTLRSLADVVREMTGADLVTLALPVGDSEELVVEAAAGRSADRVRGLALPGTTLAAKVYATGQTVSSDSLTANSRIAGGSASVVPLGPAFFVPVAGRERVRGVLQVANEPGGAPFDEAVVEMVCAFADQAALALEIAEHRRDAEQLTLLGERDRIARDLHDLVIQRLFADGLSLQAALGRLGDRPDAADRVQRVVDDLDDTIKVIRSTIFGLQHQDHPGRRTGLRSRLVALSAEASAALGFTPALRMTGLLDTDVSAHHADHLLAVLREALSNAARHAVATAVEISVEATDGTLRLTVADDGRGIDPAVTRRSGLANMHSRAGELGGHLAVGRRDPSGTVLEWSVPLPVHGPDAT